MKKISILILMVACSQLLFAQVTKENEKRITPTVNRNQVVTAKVIPASKAVMVRKNVADLKSQASRLSDSLTLTKKEIDALVDNMKNDLDSMSEMGEMESLRLQMAMDRLSKLMSTLSNLLKKMSDTAQSITQNIK